MLVQFYEPNAYMYFKALFSPNWTYNWPITYTNMDMYVYNVLLLHGQSPQATSVSPTST